MPCFIGRSESNMQAAQVKALLEAQLSGARVDVAGEGCNFQVTLKSDELLALSPVKRQQRVYSHLQAWIADGSIHAVSMNFLPGEA